MFIEVDWSERGDYIVAKHGISPVEADEALNDPMRVVIDPDPASKSGQSVRIIGWSERVRGVVTVIVLNHEGHEYGVNAWRSNRTDESRYWDEDLGREE